MQAINDAIANLSEELRSVIVLREIEGMSYDEIAKAVGCPPGTVKSRIYRAREAISEYLKPILNADAK